MENKQKTQLLFLTQWAIFFILGFLALREFFLINILAFVPAPNLLQSKRFLAFIASCVLLLAGWIGYFFLRAHPLLKKFQSRLHTLPAWLRYLASTGIVSIPGLAMWMIPLPEDFTLRAWVMVFSFYCAALAVSAIFKAHDRPEQHALQLAVIFTLSGFAYAFFAKMNQVTSYPFTTYWSEGNRFFDYSTLFGSYRYVMAQGEKIKAFVSWGMALPWAIPFLLPNISIGFYRFWYQLVWIILPMILGYTAIEKKPDQRLRTVAMVFALWAFLFIEQGPIYPPLVIGAILTVIAVRMRIPFGMILIAVASFYVRSARWTWAYAPGLWAGMMSLLAIENPSLQKGRIQQLIKPIALGLAGYFGGQLLPSILNMINRGTDLRLLPDPTASTTRQALLWERLWPNATYPPGIVLGLVWAVLPVVLFIIVLAIKKYWKINWLQILSAAAVAGTFKVVGLIASTKIGGGSNLHNLDMFLITILLILSAGINAAAKRWKSLRPIHWLIAVTAILALLSPVTYALRQNERLVLPPPDKTTESINAVRNKVEEYSTQGEILFIDHRQLLTFGLVKQVPLIDHYEKKYLMDDALTGKAENFEAFYRDLADQRFALIINEPLNLITRGEDYSFGEENDAYVRWVTTPLFCQYEPLYTSQATSLELLVPRTTPAPSYLACEEYFTDSDAP